jgi:hypothetical protein
MDETQRLKQSSKFWKTRDFFEILESESCCGKWNWPEHIREAHISSCVFNTVTFDDSLAINTGLYDCILTNCVLRDCPQERTVNCRFVNCIFEGYSPLTKGKFEGLTTVVDGNKEGFKFILLPTELKEKIMTHATRWRAVFGGTPP